ncbi:flagellar protein FlaG [Metabacillus malikii]|uniref:Flagellar protein FlaG n=1 Tax=Metabacillus malikii TaxID=1504265 RepID=A0ABT9ZGQ2_9BACI|nr:flagellar protein FlaG [Metabacillus malikii]MDQ0231463.1 flagellar protein FlaG [Metabacillus malikii]
MSVDKLNSLPALHNYETTKQTSEIPAPESTRVDSTQLPYKQPSKEEMEGVIAGINEMLQPANTHIKFELHEKLNEYYVTIVDNNTDEVVREIPSKKWLDIYAAMTDFVGLIVDKKI